ncbi:MAG TPA: NAD(P)H-dependent oxidoreductase, partial [Spirochaetota bacterium]
VYYGDVTSQLKGFIDRIYSFYVPEFWMKETKSRLSPGKKLLFVLTQGNGDEKLYSDIAQKYSTLIETHGFTEHHQLRVCGISPAQNILENSAMVKQADDLAVAMMK